jgi:hypothetical protein
MSRVNLGVVLRVFQSGLVKRVFERHREDGDIQG